MKAPFPYFGGKSKIADKVWSALGDVGHYIEPFCGSCAVLLARPDYDPQRHVETVVDKDGHIANLWRALQKEPDAVARWCDWPVSHVDLIARKKKLNVEYHELCEKLINDDDYFDTKLAGYYIWSACCWIGAGLIRPNQGPHLSDAGMGVHAKNKRQHLSDESAEVQGPYNTNIYEWFRRLSERLRYVRVVCGDYTRVLGGNWQDGPGRPVGIFFDPPYSAKAERKSKLYTEDCLKIADDVRQWSRKHADDKNYRIVIAGYYDEHKELINEGWRIHRWSASGGYGNIAGSKKDSQGKKNRHRETLFFSPHCGEAGQKTLFE